MLNRQKLLLQTTVLDRLEMKEKQVMLLRLTLVILMVL